MEFLFRSKIIFKDFNKTALIIFNKRNLNNIHEKVNNTIYKRKLLAPFSVIHNLRKAGSFQRTKISENLYNDKCDQIQLPNFSQNNKIYQLEADKWTNFRQKLLQSTRRINENNIDAIIIDMCTHDGNLIIAKSYIEYLQNYCNVEVNDGAWGKLLRVYNSFYHQQGDHKISQELQNEIYTITDRIRKKYTLLDGSLCENMIMGLVTTRQWREGLKLLEMAKITGKPTNLAYTELAIKAFLENDFDLGWSLCEGIVELQVQPKCEIFLTYLQKIASRNNCQYFQKELDKFLKILSTNIITITEKVVKLLDKIHQEHPDWFSLKRTYVISEAKEGICANCNQKLQNISLTAAEFQQLKETFKEKVLLAGDIFQKTTPQEIEAFRNYVRKTAPYDCVIDGLNVAYSVGRNHPNSVLATLLVNIVNHFVEQKKKVLILGRKHMKNWPKKSIQYLEKNAAVFLADNLSQDDPFLLYATLYSGQKTDFFSRDLMRQHAHLLGPKMKILFRRWQQEHQYSLLQAKDAWRKESNKNFAIKEPERCVIWPHCSQDGTWHLPYKEKYILRPAETFEMPKNWLCLQIIKSC